MSSVVGVTNVVVCVDCVRLNAQLAGCAEYTGSYFTSVAESELSCSVLWKMYLLATSRRLVGRGIIAAITLRCWVIKKDHKHTNELYP